MQMQQCSCSITHTERESKMLTMKFFDGLTPKYYARSNNLSNIFSKLIKSYHQYRIYKNTVNELSKLSDRELYDIGLSRGEIYDLANQSAYGVSK